jgi:hypothetical protein
MIEMKMAKNDPVNRCHTNAVLFEKPGNRNALVIATGVENQTAAARGGDQIYSAPAEKAAVTLSEKASEKHVSRTHNELLKGSH